MLVDKIWAKMDGYGPLLGQNYENPSQPLPKWQSPKRQKEKKEKSQKFILYFILTLIIIIIINN